MVSIFAGMDDTGAIRFLNEVPSGLACGCFCMVCGSALIARKGEINEWHFSHVSGQQHPECLVGARNLVRRYVEDFLTELPIHPSPDDFRTWATTEHERVPAIWNSKIHGINGWRDRPGPNTPAATVLLDRGYEADLYVVVGDESHCPASVVPERGALVATVAMPEALYLRSHPQLMAHLERSITYEWRALPDIYGVLASAQRQAEQAAKAMQRHRAAIQEAAGRRWAQIRRRTAATDHGEGAVGVVPQPLLQPSFGAPDRSSHPPPAWAEDIKPLSSIFCYRFKDGTRWVLYESQTNGFLLKPWPLDEEGWDEALPPSIGIADVNLGGYRVPEFTLFTIAVRNYLNGMRNTSNHHEVETHMANMAA